MPRPVANPPNPWASTSVEYLEGLEPPASVEVTEDDSRTILSRNDSPDLGFDFTVNPYRGCYHGCLYCYARPTHEYLGLGAGTDFERKLTVKREAPALLREAFSRPAWRGELVVFSGVTDCYQPLEASYGLTRGCLEVCEAFANPVSIVTKAPLIERDLDVLLALHRRTHLTVSVSIPIWDEASAHALEHYVATPRRRMRTIERLAAAGLDVGINVMPLVPGLGERELGELMARARDAGAIRAAMGVLRLPGHVKDVFVEGLRRRLPLAEDRILGRISEVRGGKLSDARWGVRMRGEGPYAELVGALFARLVDRHGFNREVRALPASPSPFRRPRAGPQLDLFGPG